MLVNFQLSRFQFSIGPLVHVGPDFRPGLFWNTEMQSKFIMILLELTTSPTKSNYSNYLELEILLQT